MHRQHCYRSQYDTIGQYFFCYNSLPANYYYSNNYYPCHYSCNGCSYGTNICDSCKAGFYRREGDNTNTICYSEFPGYYLEDNILKKCDSSCETCFYSTNKNCITCKNNFF